MRTLFVCALLLCFLTPVFAQRECGTVNYLNKSSQHNPLIAEKQNQVDQLTAAFIKNITQLMEGNDTIKGVAESITIPVVVHILYNKNEENISDDQVFSQIEALNNDFRKLNNDIAKVPSVFASLATDCGINFVLAKVDPDGRATTGINRKKTSRGTWLDDDKMKFSSSGGTEAWDTRQYLNIWVCNLASTILGYATFPGGPENVDGVVIRWNVFGTRGKVWAPFDKGRTTTHEVGHWLNLKHTWGDISCGDDDVHDTPKQRSYNRGCPSFPKINAGCDNGSNGDMFMNFMDFTDDACMQMFTTGQKNRMLALFAQGNVRNSLLSSKALGEPWNNTDTPTVVNTVNKQALNVFPNPADGFITISAGEGNDLSGKTIMIYSATGRLLLSTVASGNRPQINTSSLQAGIYFIRVSGSQKLPGRFIKK